MAIRPRLHKRLDRIGDTETAAFQAYNNASPYDDNSWYNAFSFESDLVSSEKNAGTLYLAPHLARITKSFNRLGLAITGAVGGEKVRLGLYSGNISDGELVLVVDSGELIVSAGTNNLVPVVGFTMTQGIQYWLAYAADSPLTSIGVNSGATSHHMIGDTAVDSTRGNSHLRITLDPLTALPPAVPVTVANKNSSSCPAVKFANIV